MLSIFGVSIVLYFNKLNIANYYMLTGTGYITIDSTTKENIEMTYSVV